MVEPESRPGRPESLMFADNPVYEYGKFIVRPYRDVRTYGKEYVFDSDADYRQAVKEGFDPFQEWSAK